MKFGSLFSGIEAASCAWLPLGWECAWVAETDPFACAVLRHHYPQVPNLSDVNRIDPDAIEPVDLVVFGSPCQSFSVAGKRLGLDDPRGNMALVGLRLIGKLRPRWVVWENVPGILSSDGGRDFGAFLGLLGELGYGFAYTVLDAQHAGVPQRRRRVFVVGYLGDWRPPAAVLFEQSCLQWNPAPRRETRQDAAAGAGDGSAYSCRPAAHGAAWRGDGADNFVAPTLESGGNRTGGTRPPGTTVDTAETLIAFGGGKHAPQTDVATALSAHPGGRYDLDTETFVCFSAKDHGADAGDTAPTLRAGGHDKSHANAGVMPAVAGHFEQNGNVGVAHSLRADGFDASEDGTGRGTPLVAVDWQNSAGGPNSEDTFQTLSTERHPAVMTLAIRGRGDSHDLEWRDDGIANAVVTPNGGRAGIGVGAVAFDTTQITSPGNVSAPKPGDPCHPLAATAHPPAIAGMSVRRLTPRECLRLMGFPDDYLDIQYRGKAAADGNKYRATGNSMAVPVVRWIGQRIQLAEDTIRETTGAAD